MIPSWLHLLAIVALVAGFVSAAIIAVDVARRPQHMGVMNVVWPVTALFGTAISLWAYFRYGRLATMERHMAAEKDGRKPPNMTETPFTMMVGKGAAHCGAGCTIGDILAEWLAFLIPGVAVPFGWGSLFADKMYAVWALDFVFAFLIGVAFQYFAIVPMRKLGPAEGIWQALKADTLSLTAWQVGMYGFMAFAQFYLYGRLLGTRVEVNSPEFWFTMQIAMICGFVTAYPVNWWLVSSGVKERM